MSGALSQGNACILYRVYRTAAPPRARALGTQVVTARYGLELALRLLALQCSVERHADRDRAHQWSRSATAPP